MKTRKQRLYRLFWRWLLLLELSRSLQPLLKPERVVLMSHRKTIHKWGLDQTATINGVLTSYVDDDGQLHYIVDDDNGTKPWVKRIWPAISCFRCGMVDLWRIQNWLENEKLQLQNIIGESAWTSGRGDFIWTQAMVDETIAEYEKILQGIKDGMMYSKPLMAKQISWLAMIPVSQVPHMAISFYPVG